MPFTLLSDEAHEVAEKYGVWKEKTINGQKIWGNERTSFIIGPDGQVEKVFRKVKPETHSQLVLSALADLS